MGNDKKNILKKAISNHKLKFPLMLLEKFFKSFDFKFRKNYFRRVLCIEDSDFHKKTLQKQI